MIGFFSSLFSTTPERVSFDDEGVTRTMPSGRTEHVAWSALVEIGILTNDHGPFAEDCWWLLIGDDGTGCAVANGAEGFPALLARLQTLPGFDNEAVVRAMLSIEDDRFRVWIRADQEALVAPSSEAI